METPISTIWDMLPEQISPPVLSDDLFWKQYEQNATDVVIHIAILSSSYLDLILNREKTVESRFSVHRRMPYERIKEGDVILFKQSGGLIKGVGYVDKVWFYELENGTLDHIKNKFGDDLQIQDQAFWDRCQKASYATLIELQHVRRIDPINFSKRDRNAWVIFSPTSKPPHR